MFHLSELFDKWNLYENERNVPLIELISIPKPHETSVLVEKIREFTNYKKFRKEQQNIWFFHMMKNLSFTLFKGTVRKILYSTVFKGFFRILLRKVPLS